MHDIDKLLDDQRDFNNNFFPPALDFETRSRQTKEFALYLFSEVDELLRKIDFKCHRKQDVQENRPAVLEELTDILKYLLSVYIVWGADSNEILENYWRKSMIVRQRHSEEFMKTLDMPCCILDIDNVLCNYTPGLLDWLEIHSPDLTERIQWIKNDNPRQYLSSRLLQIDEQRWQEFKHRFRTTHGKLTLQPVVGAVEFTQWCRSQGLQIILLTSRPIETYPNIYGDTLQWLTERHFAFDHIWWSKDKGERVLAAGVRPLVQFFVDDNYEYVRQMATLGIDSYFFRPHYDVHGILPDRAVIVQSFNDIIEKEKTE